MTNALHMAMAFVAFAGPLFVLVGKRVVERERDYVEDAHAELRYLNTLTGNAYADSFNRRYCLAKATSLNRWVRTTARKRLAKMDRNDARDHPRGRR